MEMLITWFDHYTLQYVFNYHIIVHKFVQLK